MSSGHGDHATRVHKRVNRQFVLATAFAVVPIAALAAVYYSRNERYSVDDSFITFNYARNFLHGRGLVFNVGERYFGTTAAGYALVLAAAYRTISWLLPAVTIQNVSVLLSTLSIAGACIMLLWASVGVLRRHVVLWVLYLSFVIFMFCAAPFNEVAGHETYAFLSVSLAATLLAAFRRPFLAGLVLAVAATLRPDAVLFAPIICAGFIASANIPRTPWRNKLWLRFSAGFLALMVPWIGWTTYYFGRPVPGTLEAKRAQVLLGYWPHYDVRTIVSYFESRGVLALMAVCLFIAIYLIITACASWRTSKPSRYSPMLFTSLCWASFCFLSVAFYWALNVTFWPWYGVPVVFALMVCAYTSAVYLFDAGLTGMRVRVLWAAVLAIFALTVATTGKIVDWFGTDNLNPRLYAYDEIADFLITREPDGATVETAEPGTLAFRLGPKFTVVDELGLTTPGVARAYLDGDPTYANRTYRPDYIVCSWPGKYSACYFEQSIMQNYRLVGEFDKSYWQPIFDRGALLFERVLR